MNDWLIFNVMNYKLRLYVYVLVYMLLNGIISNQCRVVDRMIVFIKGLGLETLFHCDVKDLLKFSKNLKICHLRRSCRFIEDVFLTDHVLLNCNSFWLVDWQVNEKPIEKTTINYPDSFFNLVLDSDSKWP